MGFNLEVELEHGKQPSRLAAALHLRSRDGDGCRCLSQGGHWCWCCPALSRARPHWYSLLGGEADEAAEDALGFLSLHSLPAQEGDGGLELAGEG